MSIRQSSRLKFIFRYSNVIEVKLKMSNLDDEKEETLVLFQGFHLITLAAICACLAKFGRR
jgi:hypothetical protein